MDGSGFVIDRTVDPINALLRLSARARDLLFLDSLAPSHARVEARV